MDGGRFGTAEWAGVDKRLGPANLASQAKQASKAVSEGWAKWSSQAE